MDRKTGLDKKGSKTGTAAQAPPPPKPKPPRGPPPPKATNGDNYLADFDLPSSESESDEEYERKKVDESDKIFMARVRFFQRRVFSFFSLTNQSNLI